MSVPVGPTLFNLWIKERPRGNVKNIIYCVNGDYEEAQKKTWDSDTDRLQAESSPGHNTRGEFTSHLSQSSSRKVPQSEGHLHPKVSSFIVSFTLKCSSFRAPSHLALFNYSFSHGTFSRIGVSAIPTTSGATLFCQPYVFLHSSLSQPSNYGRTQSNVSYIERDSFVRGCDHFQLYTWYGAASEQCIADPTRKTVKERPRVGGHRSSIYVLPSANVYHEIFFCVLYHQVAQAHRALVWPSSYR